MAVLQMAQAMTSLKRVTVDGQEAPQTRMKSSCKNLMFSVLLALVGLLGASQPTWAADGRFINISTRALVGTGEEVVIGGFIIEDGTRQVLIQAKGPELADDGISNALADPVLTVTRTTDPDNPIELMVNDDWEDSQGQWVSDLWDGSPPLAAGSASAAAVLPLIPGRYTAKVEGKDESTGVAIVEVYGIDAPGADGKFTNISTRALVRTGEEVVIGGFIIEESALQVLIQAKGPELVNDGISNALADPVLTVIQTSEGELPRTELDPPIEIVVNDNWGDDPQLEQLVSDLWDGSPPLTAGSASAAAVLLLEPGNYTAKVEGKDGSAGIAIIEVYGINPPPDREALTALYNATDGENWNHQANWLSDAPLDQWHGVSVDGLGRVTFLDLSQNRLTGQIPAELGNLAALTGLWLYENNLSGPIPTELANLPLERFLYFNTGLCVPEDIQFQEWLTSIPDHGGTGTSCASGDILLALYNATDGPNWTNNTNWATNAPVGEWHGVVTDAFGAVTHLQLNNNNLSGPIAAQIGNLSKLQELDLSDNNLSGPIPVQLGNLDNLAQLQLEDNHLSGSIPPELGRLANLTQLGLGYNDLSGPIPAELDRLANLGHLYLNNNNLSGPIPSELGNLTNLIRLDLGDNPLLSGPLPLSLANLPLEQFLYSNTGLCSPADVQFQEWLTSIPDHDGTERICETRDFLVALYNATGGPNWMGIGARNWLSDRPLELWDGVFTDATGAVTRLQLNNNNLTGAIPHHLGNLADLTDLWLYQNDLSGPIPPELGSLTNLHHLYLFSNNLSGTIPVQLGNLANLVQLQLADNNLSGPIPPELGNLSNLQHLGLHFNDLAGPIPPELGNLSNLQHLGLHFNDLAGPIPPELGRLSNLQSLDLHSNDLSGSIPPQLGNLVSLRALRLSENQLSGTIPPQSSNLSNLLSLLLNDNNLSGEVPPQLGSLSNLLSLQLADNNLSGPIPPELGNLSNLYVLWLFGNNLSGSIPAQLGSLTNLQFLYLNNNNLSGPIPPELGNLAILNQLDLRDNPLLSGPLPLSLTNLPLRQFSYSNTGLCVPADATLRAWLAAIPNHDGNGVDCADISLE